MIILIIFLILTVLSILVCCFVAGSTTPYDREADDEAQLEFLRKYRESKNK